MSVIPLGDRCLSTAVQELRAGNDTLNQGSEAIIICRQLGAHLFDGRIIGKDQRAAKCVREELSAKIVDKIVLAFAL